MLALPPVVEVMIEDGSINREIYHSQYHNSITISRWSNHAFTYSSKASSIIFMKLEIVILDCIFLFRATTYE